MRIIPKKIKVKNTVWRCYSMPDIIVALVVFAIIFISVTAGNWGFAIVMGLAAVIMFMPTSDGIFYSCIMENIKFLISKKKYDSNDFLALISYSNLLLELLMITASLL